MLSKNLRMNASVIFSTISSASDMVSDHEIDDIKLFVEKTINNVPGFSVEYFEIADDSELIPVMKREEMKRDKTYYCCIAVRAGNIRLIDNIEIRLA
jgi:pantoate--beta-alanine ligase